ncbi:MAG: aminotransferase class V-fold PLP-dependent enzyme [Candidatus Nanopelagicales bacterium]|nr:aminotransferase class V-fold PLP-dependent enzyme [Candidatus Nanopelagicales bacterium]
MVGNWHPPAGSLDAVGGQPVSAAAAGSMAAAAAQTWADPRALHHAGRQAGALLGAARSSVAESLSASAGTNICADEVYFTPSVLTAQALALAGYPGALVMSTVETATLLDLGCLHPGSQLVGVDALGRIDPVDFHRAAAGKALAALQLANTEVGTCQPIEQVVTADPALPIFMDASQGIGRIPLPQGWSILTAGARDWAGPAGVAILVVRRGVNWLPPLNSGSGLLGGYTDIAGAVGAATALAALITNQVTQSEQAFANIDLLRAGIANKIPDVEILGDPVWRLPHILTFSVLYISGEALVIELDKRGFAVASGSACVADEARPSHVLAAMGAYTGGNVRISLPLGCTAETVAGFLDALPSAVAAVREDT